jgi:peptide/nickel transport system ATP-binding protein
LNAPLLDIAGLGVRYQRDGAEVVALEGIALVVARGERLAIIGESGSGKSTLALAIAGLLPASARVDGAIAWPGLDGRRPVGGRDIGYVFQDPWASLDPVLTVGEQVAEVARTHLGLGWRAAYDRAAELFAQVALPSPRDMLKAYPHQLSGGQKQRVAIAAAIAADPVLLIADEATSALDTIVQAEAMALIGRLVAERAMTLLFISHDIALASGVGDRIAVFRNGRLVEIGATAELVSAPREPYTRLLIDAHIGIDDEFLGARA